MSFQILQCASAPVQIRAPFGTPGLDTASHDDDALTDGVLKELRNRNRV